MIKKHQNLLHIQDYLNYYKINKATIVKILILLINNKKINKQNRM